MVIRSAILALVLLLVCRSAGAQLPVYDAARSWQTAEGQSFNASLVTVDGEKVIFRLPNGQQWHTVTTKLSPEDLAYLSEWQKKQPIKAEMPDVVGVDSAAIKVEVISEDAKKEKFVYRTTHFQFESQGKFNQSLLREVARNFEATYELLKALPWAIKPEPEDGLYFRARLFRTKEAYIEAGGTENSSGMYYKNRGEFIVPFESIGLKIVGKSYAKDEFDSSTLVHELTHQMMHDWLLFLPPWMVEGTAEYTSILPLKVGRFRVSAAKNGLKDYLDALKARGGIPVPYPLEELFSVTPQRWNDIREYDPDAGRRLYFTSYLLVYYFMHLEGNGDRQLFLRYFREVGQAREQMALYLKLQEEFKKQPGVEVLPDGGYRFKEGMTPPEKPTVIFSETPEEFQKRMMKILLNGRTEAELMKEIRSAYIKLGIRL